MDQEFKNSRLFRHRLYFKTDIHLAINPDLCAWGGQCLPPTPLLQGGECAMATIRGQVGGVNNKMFRTRH